MIDEPAELRAFGVRKAFDYTTTLPHQSEQKHAQQAVQIEAAREETRQDALAPVRLPERFRGPWRIRQLVVQRLPISNAAAHELRPVRDNGQRVGLPGQQPPQSRVMPAKLVFGAVAVVANARAQLTDLGDQLVTRHLLEIVIHRLSLGHGKPIRQDHRRVPRSSAHKRTPASHLGSRVVGWLTPQPQPRRVARD